MKPSERRKDNDQINFYLLHLHFKLLHSAAPRAYTLHLYLYTYTSTSTIFFQTFAGINNMCQLIYSLDKISHKADVFDCHVVEVGSGPGALTRSLLNQEIRHLHAVEIDHRFIPSLEVRI